MFGFLTKPSREKFVQLVLAAFRAGGITQSYEYDQSSYSLKRGTGTLWLENTYHAYCQADRAGRKRIFDNFVAMEVSLATKPQRGGWAEAAPSLIAGVRERIVFDFTTSYLTTGNAEQKLPQVGRPLTRWFSETLLLDFPTHIAYVTPDQLKDWGVGIDEAFAVGLENLREATAPKFTLEEDIFISAWKDDYDSSRLLTPEVFAGLPLNGKPVIVAPNRLTLMVAGADDTAAVVRMLERAERIVREEAKPQNPAPLTIEDGRVVDFVTPEASPLRNAVQRAHGVAAILYYQDQQRALEEFHTKSGKDIFVGTFTLMQRDDGSYRSHAMWARDVVTLLPEADDVVFYDPTRPEGAKVVATVPWSRVRAQLDDLMLDTKLFPPRFYVSRFPTSEQLAAMTAPG